MENFDHGLFDSESDSPMMQAVAPAAVFDSAFENEAASTSQGLDQLLSEVTSPTGPTNEAERDNSTAQIQCRQDQVVTISATPRQVTSQPTSQASSRPESPRHADDTTEEAIDMAIDMAIQVLESDERTCAIGINCEKHSNI